MYCPNCGKKIPSHSKFCPKCGSNISEADGASAPKKEKPKRSRAYRIANWIGYCVSFLLIIYAVFYFVGVSKIAKQKLYTHPIIGFTFSYPKTLNLETPALPAASKCSAEPCLVVLKNPTYGDEGVNWIIVLPLSLTGMTKEKATSEFEKDVTDGWATALTVNGLRMYKYVNDPAKPIENVIMLYKMMGLDPAKEQSLYLLISADSFVGIGFRTPPAGAPADYKDYLNIQNWKNPTATSTK